MASFRSEAEAFSGMSGMVEGHARYARGLKPRALDRGVVHLCISIFVVCKDVKYFFRSQIHCNRNVIASEALHRPTFRGVQGQAKQSPQIATLARPAFVPQGGASRRQAKRFHV